MVRFAIETLPLCTKKTWYAFAPLTVNPLAPAPLIAIVPLALFNAGSALPSVMVLLVGRLNVTSCVPAPAALACVMAHRNVPTDPLSAVLVTWKVEARVPAEFEN